MNSTPKDILFGEVQAYDPRRGVGCIRADRAEPSDQPFYFELDWAVNPSPSREFEKRLMFSRMDANHPNSRAKVAFMPGSSNPKGPEVYWWTGLDRYVAALKEAMEQKWVRIVEQRLDNAGVVLEGPNPIIDPMWLEDFDHGIKSGEVILFPRRVKKNRIIEEWLEICVGERGWEEVPYQGILSAEALTKVKVQTQKPKEVVQVAVA